MEAYEKLKLLLSKNLGYIGKFTEYLMNENITYNELETLYKKLLYLKERNKDLNISDLKYEKVLDKIQDIENDISIKSLVNQFPSEQKQIASSILKDELGYGDYYTDFKYNYNILLKASKKENTRAFVSKISRYKDAKSLINALIVFAKDSQNDRESVIKLISTLKSEILFQNDNVIVVKVDSQEDVQKMGSDTSWCIVSSLSQWKKYTKGRYQFILYDYEVGEYDPKFKIGFTVNKDYGIYAAHDILDSSCIPYLRDKLKENNISLEKIFVREKNVIDLDKINSKATQEYITSIVEECDTEMIIPLVNKIISLAKPDSFKSKVIKLLMDRYFANKTFLLPKDYNDINPELIEYYDDNKKTIIDGQVNTNLNEEVFLEGMKIWKNQDYDYFVASSILPSRWHEEYSDDTIRKISDKLNEVYKDDKVKYRGKKEDKGIKFVKQFEASILGLNAYLGRIKETPDYQKLIEADNYCYDSYQEYLKLPIDLNNDRHLTDDKVQYVIKKDYPDTYVYISSRDRGLGLYTKLINHLGDHIIKFEIDKKTLKDKIVGWDKKDERLVNILKQFKTTKLKVGDEITDGNITVKIIG